MKKLRNKFERFCYENRNKGIPNLMLYVSIGSAIVYVMSLMDRSYTLYSVLCFNRDAILHGQIWRLFTFPLVYGAGSSNILLMAISLVCYYSLGRAIENLWGTFRFNLFYFTGMILMDAFCMIFGYPANISYLNMSLLLGFATLYPDTRLMLFFFIPIRSWLLALIYLGLTLRSVALLFLAVGFPYCLLPLVAIGNYFLFFGADVVNVLPPAWRRRKRKDPKVVDVPPVRKAAPKQDKTPYTHRCVVCGRTDISHPNLELRYCSRCKGYFCYCEDHINNHNHVE